MIWDGRTKKEIGSYKVHREEIAAVGVSAKDQYVISLGGMQDGTLVLWDVNTKRPICSKLKVIYIQSS